MRFGGDRVIWYLTTFSSDPRPLSSLHPHGTGHTIIRVTLPLPDA